jgi:hypothetical protein
MSLDTYSGIAGKVLLRCPKAGPLLARDWVVNAFRRIAERRAWSWLIKQGQFIMYPMYTTGTVTLTQGSATVPGVATGWTTAQIGRQFRTANNTPIYTVTAVDVVLQTLTLDLPWGPASVAGTQYKIYDAYVTVPSDFNYLITVWDPNYNWQLHLTLTQRELNSWDAQRSNQGQPSAIVFRDYYAATAGVPALPRFEIWPHVVSAYTLPYLYVARATDLNDTGALLPRYIRGDVLLQAAMLEASQWPGPSADEPNPYYSNTLARSLEDRLEYMIQELERQDEEICINNIVYDMATHLPWAPYPMGADFWQKHAL